MTKIFSMMFAAFIVLILTTELANRNNWDNTTIVLFNLAFAVVNGTLHSIFMPTPTPSKE